MRWSVWWSVSALLLGGSFELIFDSKDSSCQSLAEQGFWQHKTDHHVWQPTTCTLGHYTANHIEQCFQDGGGTLNFIGDSTLREIFVVVAQRIQPDFKESEEKHMDQHAQSTMSNLSIHFYWDPFLQHPRLIEQMATWRNGTSKDGVLMMGGGLHFAGFAKEPLEEFSERYNALILPLGSSSSSSSSSSSKGLHVYVNPLLPTEQMLVKSNPRKSILLTLERENPLNNYLKDNIPDTLSLTTLWSYNEQVFRRPDTNKVDGIHVVDEVNELKADIFLNHYCNSELAIKGTLPAGATCCLRYGNFRIIQFFSLFLWLSSIALILSTSKRGMNRKEIIALLHIGITCIFALVCDRTDAFGKIEKLHNETEFLLIVLIAVILPIIFSITTTTSNQTHLNDTFHKGQDILNRFQTDEWKGWMQAFILLYHWTGTSKIIWIYRSIRLLVAAYLFITGYGNTIYYLRTGDYSIKRLFRQLLRLNLLTSILSYTMNTSYLEYYFAPFVSFWIIIIYATMASFHHYNLMIKFFCLKLFISSLSISILVKTTGILETILQVFGIVFQLHWQVNPTRSRIALDLYIVYFGMMMAFALNWYATTSDDFTFINLQIKRYSSSSTILHLFISSICISIILAWIVFSIPLSSNDMYNSWHPYISPFVIIAFVILRNNTSRLRKSYSSSMARLGRCSLETFTLQFHIFLANDTHATLTLGLERYFGQQLWLRYMQLTILLILFLNISEEVAKASGILVNSLVVNSLKDESSTYHTINDTNENVNDLEEKMILLTDNITFKKIKYRMSIYLKLLSLCVIIILLNYYTSP